LAITQAKETTISASAKKNKKNASQPITITHNEHSLSCDDIGKNALKVLHGLKDAGFDAYLVGGGVRDLLLGLHPKDFDIATDAQPEQIRKIFRNCILIGRRFRLAHVRFGREIIEVATFRAGAKQGCDKHKLSEHGMLLRDNVYGTIEEDAWRRDFTINALYYRIKDFSIIDYTGGIKDLEAKTIRMIGDPIVRYREDPVRMMRAIRLAAKTGLEIANETSSPITKLMPLFENISSARLFDEVAKWFRSGKSLETFYLLQEYKLFEFLFPSVAKNLQSKKNKIAKEMLRHGFANTDKRISEDKPINPAFLYAVLLWWPLQEQIEALCKKKNIDEFAALPQAMRHVLQKQKNRISIPQRLLFTIKDIWVMQYQMMQKKKRRIYSILAHPKFRAAYDFLLLRAQAGEKAKEAAKWWTQIQEVNETKRREMINEYIGEKCQTK
jgi:poly(A) polymerase